MGFSCFLPPMTFLLLLPPVPQLVSVPCVPPVWSQSAVLGLLVSSLYVFLFLYHGCPPLLGGCALGVRRNVRSAHRSGAGEGRGAWGGILGSWCQGEKEAGEDLALVAGWERQDMEVALPELFAAPWSISWEVEGLTLKQLAPRQCLWEEGGGDALPG